jgi:transposase
LGWRRWWYNLKTAYPAYPPDDSGLRFGPDVPVQEIEMLCPELEADPEGYEVIGTKVTYRLAQRTAAFVILKYTRKIIKPKQVANAKPITPPAPANVLDKSFADVSFVAGLLIDKFDYHLPLYRQHRRLLQTGITLSRSTLTNICYKAILLLEPIFDALFRSVLLSKILAMDETPIKYSRKTKGKMKTGYYWPIFGDNNEIVFCFSPSRATRVIHELLGDFSGTLVTEGYTAYERYSNKMGTATRSQCWSHARRPFDKALKMEPNDAKQGLQMIAALYQH